jgi:hypothetical protein
VVILASIKTSLVSRHLYLVNYKVKFCTSKKERQWRLTDSLLLEVMTHNLIISVYFGVCTRTLGSTVTNLLVL